MKLGQLLEMPQIKREELPVDPTFGPFLSQVSIERNFELIFKGETGLGFDYLVVIRKDRLAAAIGYLDERSDGVVGLRVTGYLEFKPPSISGMQHITLPPHALQVGRVRVAKASQALGWGMRLYAALADAGFAIISDNLQYLGGQALWQKIAKQTLNGHYQVFVIKQGEVVMDGDHPVIYDGSSIDDSELWSEDCDQKNTLFVLKKGST